ncbi:MULTISPECIES: hypothetical protein [Actinokineospora]|uniref:WXG100 family type VII secretion target n=2 Tax=Actinokineospora TaxID=39845 RepID=A0A421AWX8_9PSEU|nr:MULTISPECIES: hypothetical protein [Actinokineospora]RLK54332.1 hypothetical protein CLV68_5882 [Actinokineospora cianjurensis]SEQ96150.1 hypothetical protein SAMN04487818_10193 [Actinokineospora terrae]
MANRYGYDDATLQGIITATETSLQNMGNLNQGVMNIQAMLPSVNNSTSGMKLAAAIGDWTGDFNVVKTQLEALNGKATALLQTNRTAETDADSASNGAS